MQKNVKNIDGKLPVAPTEAEKNEVKSTFAMPKIFHLVASMQTNKDKKGSNPFSMHAPHNSEEVETSENRNELNIFI